MRKGLVLGKFMPIHNGHIKLIKYAARHCDSLIVWVCASNKEAIPGNLRLKWVSEIFKNQNNIKPIHLEYDEAFLPNSSESSKDISQIWSDAIKKHLPKIDIIFTSEKYGDYVAEYLDIKHVFCPINRLTSASLIRKNPFKNWEFIPNVVKPFFYRKISILGTESTDKSTLVKNLAEHFNADFVSEVGREIVEQTNFCQPDDLKLIAQKHAKEILSKHSNLNRMLFIDTDISTTKSYSKFLFNHDLAVEKWIIEANKCDLYLN